MQRTCKCLRKTNRESSIIPEDDEFAVCHWGRKIPIISITTCSRLSNRAHSERQGNINTHPFPSNRTDKNQSACTNWKAVKHSHNSEVFKSREKEKKQSQHHTQFHQPRSKTQHSDNYDDTTRKGSNWCRRNCSIVKSQNIAHCYTITVFAQLRPITNANTTRIRWMYVIK